MRVLFAASEIFPLVKTGGLADVAYSLPKALIDGFDVQISLIMPAYKEVKEQVEITDSYSIGDLFGVGNINILKSKHPLFDIELYLVDCPYAFNRDGGIYLDKNNIDWLDNDLRFAIFSKAVAHFFISSGLIGKPFDIIHCNDWQTGAVLAYLKQYKIHGLPSIFTIHNLQYQGNFNFANMEKLGLSAELYHINGMEYYGNISYMKAGIAYCDKIVTVSQSYAEEISTPEFGMGLDGFISYHKGKLLGILNGIDSDIWQPKTDELIEYNFTADDFKQKERNKEYLSEKLSLAKDRPLLGIVSRFSEQKGLDVFIRTIDDIINHGFNIVILGSGDSYIEAKLKEKAKQYQNYISVSNEYDEAFSHQIFAAADFTLIPSRFEPCGLTQLYAMAYGTIPIVRNTGGLKDTVKDIYVSSNGNGITFEELNEKNIIEAIRRAKVIFDNKHSYTKLRSNTMLQDYSWHNSAKSWANLYKSMLRHK